jgi:hypothetical protein
MKGSNSSKHHRGGHGGGGSNRRDMMEPEAQSPDSNSGTGRRVHHGSEGRNNSGNTPASTPPTSSPTTAAPTSSHTRNLMSTASSMVTVRYFDEGAGSWVMRRPAHATAAQLKSFAVLSISIGDPLPSPAAEGERFRTLNQYMDSNSPAIVALVEVHEAQFQFLLEQPCVRQHYAVTDWHKTHCTLNADGERSEHGCIFLVRHHVHVDFAECQKLPDTHGNFRPFILLYSRNFSGVQTTFGVTHVDPTSSMEVRVAAVTNALSRFSQVDFSALTGNLRDNVADHRDDPWLLRECNQVGYSEVGESLDAPLGFMVKQQSKVQVTQVHNVELKFRSSAVYQFALRSSVQAAAAGAANNNAAAANAAAMGPIAIPQPRSAKGGPGTPPTAPQKGTPPLPPDPAIVGSEDRVTPSSVPRGNESTSAFPPGPKQQTHRWRWRKDHTFHLKNPRLTQDESLYDLSHRFNSVQEAIEALNSGAAQWPAEFAVIHHTIIAADSIPQCDLKAFRRYVSSKPNPWTQMSAAAAATLNSVSASSPSQQQQQQSNSIVQLLQESTKRAQSSMGADLAAPSVSVGFLGASYGSTAVTSAAAAAAAPLRVRVWTESNCAIIYQVTPKEMKFDITNIVGLVKNNLKAAISRLNAKKTMATKLAEKPDPLLDHPHDYALLYCPVRQGYWLIAASDVPCDIIACRLAAA